MTDQKSVSVLEDVLRTLVDSVDGYEKAAEIAERPQLVEFFNNRAASRKSMVENVRAQIAQFGGTAEKDGSLLAQGHRLFLTIRHTLQNDDKAAIEAVDNGERFLREKVKNAVNDNHLAASSRSILREHLTVLEADARAIEHLEDIVA